MPLMTPERFALPDSLVADAVRRCRDSDRCRHRPSACRRRLPPSIARAAAWIGAAGFAAAAGEVALSRRRTRRGQRRVGAVRPRQGASRAPSLLAGKLARRRCRRASIASATASPIPRLASLAFALGAYRFTRYRADDGPGRAGWSCPTASTPPRSSRIADGVYLARDLINTPANDLGPAELAEAAARTRRAPRRRASPRSSATRLLGANFPLIHAVGAAATPARAPRLIDFTWGDPGDPQGHPRRQGRLLRYRRPRHQAVRRHAADEEGHGRRRQRARPRPHDHGRRAARSASASSSRPSRMPSPAPPSGPATSSGAARA